MLLLLLLIFVSLIVETCSRSCCYFRCLLLQSVRSWGIEKAVLVATMFSKTLKVATGFAVALGGLLISSDECEESAWRAQRAARARTREFSLSLSLFEMESSSNRWRDCAAVGSIARRRQRVHDLFGDSYLHPFCLYRRKAKKRERETKHEPNWQYRYFSFLFAPTSDHLHCTALSL